MDLSTIYFTHRRLGAAVIPVSAREALGREIRRLRRERGLSQAQLALPLTRAYVSAVERGRVVPSLASLLLMAHRLGVPAAQLLAAVESPTPWLVGRSRDA